MASPSLNQEAAARVIMMKQGHGFDGHVDRIENGWVFGWAWNDEIPESPIEIDILVNGRRESTVIANLYRPDLEDAGKGNGRHAFEAAFQARAQAGEQLALSVRFSGTDQDVPGSPQMVSPRPQADTESGRAQGVNQLMGPTFRSRFGGLWTDLSNAPGVIDGKASLGWISAEEAGLLKRWVEDGFVILPRAVPHDLIDALDADVERIWTGTSSDRCFVEYYDEGSVLHPAGPQYKDKRAKLLDLHGHLESAREVIFSAAIQRFVSLLFERPLLAFQCLYFRWGSRQAIHQDTAFVKVSSPLEFVASWIALEDIQPHSGELEYYKGSHTLPEYLFEGRHKWMPTKSPEHGRYHAALHDRSAELGLERQTFVPRKGDALIWSADLAHGGSQHVVEGLTRKSIVTHYCPIDCDPVYADGRQQPQRIRHGDHAFYAINKRT
jgi:phytanoyl-CoA dioxygenase PhyH